MGGGVTAGEADDDGFKTPGPLRLASISGNRKTHAQFAIPIVEIGSSKQYNNRTILRTD